MRRLGRRVYAEVIAYHPHKRVRLRLGDETFELAPLEAIDLADRLVDATEKLRTEISDG